MTTDVGLSILDPARTDRITTQARDIQFSRTMLTLIAGIFFLIGWVLAKTFTALWFAAAWSYTAIKVGWEEGRKSARPPGRQ